MFNGTQVWYEIVGITGAISALCIFLYSVYKIAKRIDAAIGVDGEGRTLSDRMDKVEYQLWPNGGQSMADRVNSIDKTNNQMMTEVQIIKELVLGMIDTTQQASVEAKKNNLA
ncbi:MAG: hypothetical protein EBU08_07955 [Micrococcales bacterium]|nr:hypothetical protein [Micrococcales bacterium]